MKAPDKIAEVRAELVDIENRLAELRPLTARKERLAAFLRQYEALYSTAPKKQAKAATAVTPVRPVETVAPGATIAQYILHALKQKGPMDIGGLLAATRSVGWAGSGDDKIDKKRLYAAMRADGRFHKDAGGKWTSPAVAAPLLAEVS
jgi:hypothetical protein